MKHKNSISGASICCAVVVCVACGGVGKSDSSFWEPGHDVGGTDYNLATGVSTAGAAGQPVGVPTGTNNPPPFGAGGSGGPGGGPPPFGAGGFVDVPGGGGAPPSFGGQDPGGGGVQQQGAGGTTEQLPPPPPGNSGPCDFTFNVTTVTARGQFAPKNVGALWIEDSGGKFVKSLEVWGGQRLPNLTSWVNVSGNNKVDAVTSATHGSHGPHSGHWNCSDVNKASVVNAGYQACVSFTESDTFPFFGATPPTFCAPFNKGSGPATSSPPNQTNFTAMQLIMK
jgi:hypothetical protein